MIGKLKQMASSAKAQFVQLVSSSEYTALQGALAIIILDPMVSMESLAHAQDNVTALDSIFKCILF